MQDPRRLVVIATAMTLFIMLTQQNVKVRTHYYQGVLDLEIFAVAS